MSEEIELAWAAGFFDGEGCTYWVKAGGIVIGVAQVGTEKPEVLIRFQAAVGGIGKIYGPYKNTKGNPKWTFNASSRDAQAILTKLWPYLGSVKRAQALQKESNYLRESTKRLATLDGLIRA